MKPKVQDKDIFSLIALAFDMTGKHGFVLLVNNEQPKPLQYVQQALIAENDWYKLTYIERFKVHKNIALSNIEFEFFVALKVKIPRGVTVSAQQVKDKIEDNILELLCLLTKAY